MTNDRSGVYHTGRPSNPPFLKMRVRPTIVASLATAVAVTVGVFGVLVFLSRGNLTVMEMVLSPGVVLITFVGTLLNQLYLRGHYCRIASWLKVGETLAFYFSMTLLMASFVGTLAFTAKHSERIYTDGGYQRGDTGTR